MKRREEASVPNLNVAMSQLFHRTSGVAARGNTNQFRVVGQFDWWQENNTCFGIYPRARRLTLESGGHYPHVTRAEEFNRFVEDMLESELAG